MESQLKAIVQKGFKLPRDHKSHLFSIAGPVGAGKSTLLSTLNLKGVHKVQEDVALLQRNELLEQYCKDPKRHAFDLQVRAFTSRINCIMSVWNAQDKIVAERTVMDDAFVFALHNAQIGNMSESEMCTYIDIFQLLYTHFGACYTPEKIVYLKATTDICMDRIASRGRPGENSYTREYMEAHVAAYDHMIAFIQEKLDVKVMVVDASISNSTQSYRELLEKIEAFLIE